MKVDLRDCKKGDILISKHGGILEFVEVLPESDYMDVKVKYLYVQDVPEFSGSNGTRTFEGETYRNAKLDTDHDIVSVIDRNKLIKLLQ